MIFSFMTYNHSFYLVCNYWYTKEPTSALVAKTIPSVWEIANLKSRLNELIVDIKKKWSHLTSNLYL